MPLDINPDTIALDYDTLAARTAPAGDYKVHYDLLDTYKRKRLAESLLTVAYHASMIDIAKKALFYGKDDVINEKANSAYSDHMHRFDRQKAVPFDIEKIPVDILHSIMGMVTEIGEIIEACLTVREVGDDGFYNIDKVNLVEEYGDVLWYVPLGLRVINSNVGDCMYINIRKLEARFPDKFDTYSANNRNLVHERKILENGVERETLEYTGDGFPIAPWTGPQVLSYKDWQADQGLVDRPVGYQPILTDDDFK